ncbi:MAG: hypothetical protein IPI45_11860 [Saprospiraceae bacterium]|nr:hypothetical protein [Saprospiraceae bacterium]MBK7738459.1 hypothetical protein [Saprospiraceae bacterium]MBK7912969.1 hypothetical protein [Saprospiraceae bacterium]
MQLSNIITIGFFLFNCIVANTQHTFSEHIKLHCDDSVIRNNLGYPTWNPATIIKKPHFGFAEIREDSSLRQTLYYRPPKYFHGFDTLMVLCAKATQITCDTGIYILDIICNASIDSFLIINTECDVVDTFKIDFRYETELSDKPIHGQASLLPGPVDDLLLYQAESKFAGQDYVVLYLNQLKLYWVLIYNVTCKQITGVENNSIEHKKSKAILVNCDLLNWERFNLDAIDKEYLLFDALGNQYKVEKEIQSGRMQLKLDPLPNGSYFLVYTINKQMVHQRIILVR